MKKTEFGIQFFDVDNLPLNSDLIPKVHHFRSANISTVTKELEKHWDSILQNNICIPTHEILIGNEDEIVQYRKTTFLRDRIEIDNSLPIYSKSLTAPDNYIEKELEDLEDCTVVEVGDFVEDCTVAEVDNIDITDDVDFDRTSRCVNDDISGPSKPSQNSNCLLTREANAIHLVLGEMSPFLVKYDCEKDTYKNLMAKQVGQQSSGTSNDYTSNLLDMQSTLQTQVLKKKSTLKRDFENWERSFLVAHDFGAPDDSDMKANSSIADIVRRINIANQLLRKWAIAF